MSDSQKKKERKGGGALPWGSGATPIGSTPGLNVASGAMRVGSALGNSTAVQVAAIQAKILAAAKIGLALSVIAGAGVGGYGLYDMGRRGGFGVEAPKSASGGRLFDRRPSAGAPPEVGVFGGSGAPSGLALARKANEGAFDVPEEGGDKADAVADGEEWQEEETVDEAGDAAGGGMPDAAGMAQQMAGAMGGGEEAGGAMAGGLGHKFGNLSSQMAGGQTSARLSGGAGLSGGIGGKGFGGQKLSKSQMDKMRGLSKGRRAKTVRTKQAVGQGRGRGLKGATAKKLSKMQGVMASAKKANAETEAAAHTQQWDGADSGGQGIQGGGASGVGSDGSSGGSSSAGLDDGGPLGGGTGGGGDENWDDYDTDPCSNGSCGNMTPYQGMVDMVVALSVIEAILMALIGVVAKIPVYGTAAAMLLCKVCVALGAIIALAGMAIMGLYGQMVQGGSFLVLGTTSAICAYVAMGDGGAEFKVSQASILATLAGSVSALLGAAVGNNTMGEADDNGNVS